MAGGAGPATPGARPDLLSQSQTLTRRLRTGQKRQCFAQGQSPDGGLTGAPSAGSDPRSAPWALAKVSQAMGRGGRAKAGDPLLKDPLL